MKRLEKTEKVHRRLDDYGKKKYSVKKRQLRDDVSIGERVYVPAERIKNKSAPGKFYKQSVQNISYFNEDKVFIIRAKKAIDNVTYYWLKNSETNRNLPKRFSRFELFPLRSNFF